MTKKPKLKAFPIVLIIVCAAHLAVTALLIVGYMLSFTLPDASVQVSGRNNMHFKVYYLENDFFDAGVAVPQNLHYLMSYTDYIEVENSFSADFSQVVDISYRYTASETLRIKHARNGNGNGNGNTNPVVYEEIISLEEINGSASGDTFYLNGNDPASPGGTYIIHPKEHIETYRHFVEEQLAQMQKENVMASRAVAFGADLVVDFTYNIRSETGVNETVSRGIIIPLTDEVFSPEDVGTPMFEISIPVRVFKMPGLLTIVLLVLWLVALVAGIFYGIWRFGREKDPLHSELNSILKKYSDEITISMDPLDLSEQKVMYVPYFTELLKLAINLNKHILCYYDDEKAEFCVLADGYAHCYVIWFEPEGQGEGEAPEMA